MFEKILLQLLQSKNRVIIPRLGAFILKKPGEMDSMTFNSILKFDDGILSAELMQLEKIEKSAADEKIKTYTDTILKQINEGNQVKFEGIGTLYKDANGKIQFLELKGAAPEVKVPEKKEITEEKKTEVKPPVPPVEDKKETPPVTPPPTPPTPPTPPPPVKDEKKTDPPVIPVPPKEEKKVVPVKTEVKSTPKPVSIPPKQKKAKSGASSKNVLWITVVILVVGIGVTSYLLFFQDKTDMGKDTSLLDENLSDSLKQMEEEILSDETVDEEATENEKLAENTEETKKTDVQKEEVKKDPVKKHSSPTGRYYVIAGCFQDENNADKLVTKLQAEGYNGAEKFGVVNGLHAVCFSSFDNLQEANRSMNEIRNSREENAWIKKY